MSEYAVTVSYASASSSTHLHWVMGTERDHCEPMVPLFGATAKGEWAKEVYAFCCLWSPADDGMDTCVHIEEVAPMVSDGYTPSGYGRAW